MKGKRYTNAEKLARFNNEFTLVNFLPIITHLTTNMDFFMAKTSFPWLRYGREHTSKKSGQTVSIVKNPLTDSDDPAFIYKRMATIKPTQVHGCPNIGDLQDEKSKYDDYIIEFNTDMIAAAQDKRMMKKYYESLMKYMCQSYAIFTTLADHDDFYLDLCIKIDTIIEIMKAKRVPNLINAKLIMYDGFIMEGKTTHSTNFCTKITKSVYKPEDSEIWRHEIKFEDKPVSFMEFKREVGNIAFINMLHHLYTTEDMTDKTLVFDRSPFSMAIFNESMLTISCLFTTMMMLNLKNFTLRLMYRKDYSMFSFPLKKERAFETRVYKDTITLAKNAKQYYTCFGKIFRLFGASKELISTFTDLENVKDTYFSSMDDEELFQNLD